MVERDFGQATIAYEDPEDGTVEHTVENEHVAYFQDHWIVRTGEDERGRDTIRRIPAQRVYFVEREVEEFEQEVRTIRDQVQSIADELRNRLPVGEPGRGGRGRGDAGESEVQRIEVERGEPAAEPRDEPGEDRDDS